MKESNNENNNGNPINQFCTTTDNGVGVGGDDNQRRRTVGRRHTSWRRPT